MCCLSLNIIKSFLVQVASVKSYISGPDSDMNDAIK